MTRIPPQLLPFIRDTRYWTRRLRAASGPGFEVNEEEPNRLVPFQFARVELKKVNTDGTADAYLCVWSEDDQAYKADTEAATLKIRSCDGSAIAGVGKDLVSSTQNGTRMWVIHPMDRGSDQDAEDTWEPLVPGGSSGTATGSTGTLTTDYTLVSLDVLRPNSTSDLTLAGGGIQFANTGEYLVSAIVSIYTAGSTAFQDLYAILYQTDDYLAGSEAIAGQVTSCHGEVTIPPFKIRVTAGDTVWLYAKTSLYGGNVVKLIMTAERVT